MSDLFVHPAATFLSESERLEYIRLVASIALADGQTDQKEMAKLVRLADALHLHTAITDPLFTALYAGTLDVAVSPREALWFKEQKHVRWHLMIDSIAIAFSDGTLTPAETERLTDLAHILEIYPEDAVRMAGVVEKLLFKRDEDHGVLARQLGEALGQPEHGEHIAGRVRHLAGEP